MLLKMLTMALASLPAGRSGGALFLLTGSNLLRCGAERVLVSPTSVTNLSLPALTGKMVKLAVDNPALPGKAGRELENIGSDCFEGFGDGQPAVPNASVTKWGTQCGYGKNWNVSVGDGPAFAGGGVLAHQEPALRVTIGATGGPEDAEPGTNLLVCPVKEFDFLADLENNLKAVLPGFVSSPPGLSGSVVLSASAAGRDSEGQRCVGKDSVHPLLLAGDPRKRKRGLRCGGLSWRAVMDGTAVLSWLAMCVMGLCASIIIGGTALVVMVWCARFLQIQMMTELDSAGALGLQAVAEGCVALMMWFGAWRSAQQMMGLYRAKFKSCFQRVFVVGIGGHQGPISSGGPGIDPGIHRSDLLNFGTTCPTCRPLPCQPPERRMEMRVHDGWPPPTNLDTRGCPHSWFELGFCDDLSCGDGTIWRCARCGVWYCDGPCERQGYGQPPLLDVVGEATRYYALQLIHLVRVGNFPWRTVLFLANLAFGEAVTCRTCFDQIGGCTGGANCPLITTSTANGAILAGIAAGTATVLVARDIFPLRFTRVLHRGILDSLLVVGRRPPPGTPVDIGSLSTAQLSDPVATAGVELDSMLQEVGTRLAAATSQLEVSRLNAITTNLTARQKLTSGAKGAVDLGDGTSTIVGVYRYCVVLALRIVRTKPTDVTVVTDGERAGSSDDGARGVPPAKLSRPASESEFFGMLTVWTMLLAGLGVAPVLVSGVFLMDVVYTPLQEGTITWLTAFELFLVYLEEVEREAGDDVNLSNVYQRGAQDTFLMRARERAPKSGKEKNRIFRPGDDDEGAATEWNGSWNRKAKACCITFNLGNKKHPASALNERGGCKYNHVCDHWVDDKGPGGTCGGDHPRVKCSNPHKCDKELK